MHGFCRDYSAWFDRWERGELKMKVVDVPRPPPPLAAPDPESEERALRDLQDNYPCIHRGDYLREVQCNCGPGNVAPVHECRLPLFEECTPRYGPKIPSGIKACSHCPMRARYVAPLFKADECCVKDFRGDPAPQLQDMYRGAACFLVCGGPSTATQRLSEVLNRRGVLVASVNNAGAGVVRPDIWFSVDQPRRFHDAIWKDPKILKLVKWRYRLDRIRTKAGAEFRELGPLLKKYPNTWFLEWKADWHPQTFLTHPLPTWGLNEEQTDVAPEGTPKRSVMLIALRMLYWLGIRRLYLLGCDFKMEAGRPYAFDQYGDEGKARSNNKAYEWLNRRYLELRHHFADYGYGVVNCTPDSNLTAFPTMPLDSAIRECLGNFPQTIDTDGWYDK